MEKVNDFISESLRRHGDNLFGAIAFGSLVKGSWRESSDVDIMLLFNECDYSRNIKIYDGLKFEVYNMPTKIFFSPFSGDGRKIFFDMFRLQVLESGKILYERGCSLSRLLVESRGRKIPCRYVDAALNRDHNLINAAEKYVYKGHIGKAELKMRGASINLARALLMKAGISEINTPRLLIPHIRRKFPEVYSVLREIYGLNGVGKSEVEDKIEGIRETLNSVRRKFEKNLGLEGVIDRIGSELSSAEDCLKIGDHDSAMMQAETFELMLVKNLSRHTEYPAHMPIPRNLNGGNIKEYISVLKEIEEKYF
ncbi:MAG: nucleotidyltransferase domain-containing protein [Candidatus Bathyarchaeota archaeon]|nr:nucleotidyltransferase domain-containing protein [Candidatus Bathyarchaeota archaeon]